MRLAILFTIGLVYNAFAGCPAFTEESLRVKLRGVESLKTAKRPIFTIETDKKVVKSVELKSFDLSGPSHRWDIVLRSNDIARACENIAEEVEVLVCDDTNLNGSCRDEADKRMLATSGLRFAYPLLPMDLILKLVE